ncbi:hypothetical protein LTR91_002677, partial [Friedmanniomyces endolithicus]
MRRSDDKEAKSAKAIATKAREDLKRALKAFDYNCNYTASNKTTPRRRNAVVALAL